MNANGPIYGALEASADYMPVVDPTTHTASQVKLQVRDPKTPSEAQTPPAEPSPYWGDEAIWTSQTSAHSFAMDKAGARLGRGAHPSQPDVGILPAGLGRIRPPMAFPINQSGRQMQMYDPKTKKVTTIDTCFGTHHLNFDDNDVLWFTGGGAVEGWFDTKVYDKTKDEQKAQGWTVFVLDTNGNGKRDAYVEPDQPIDPDEGQADQRAVLRRGAEPGRRLDLGIGPGHARIARAADARVEPAGDGAVRSLRSAVEQPEGAGSGVCAARHGRRQQRRRLDGAVERAASPASTGASARVRSTGRPRPASTARKAGRSTRCRVRTTRAPTDSASADSAYYNFVDRFDMLGLGKDVPLATGNGSEALLALVDGKFLTFRVPYPMGFYAKGIDGRIDDPNAGWKGKGIWTTYATRAPFHVGRRQGHDEQGRQVPGAPESAGEVGRTLRHQGERREKNLKPSSGDSGKTGLKE